MVVVYRFLSSTQNCCSYANVLSHNPLDPPFVGEQTVGCQGQPTPVALVVYRSNAVKFICNSDKRDTYTVEATQPRMRLDNHFGQRSFDL